MIRFVIGPEALIPTLADGQPAFSTDTYKLFVGMGGTNREVTGGAGTPGGSVHDIQANNGIGGFDGITGVASGSFLSLDGKTVTVTYGVITSIV